MRPFAPGVEVLVVTLPFELVELFAVGVVGVAWVVEQHVGVEVAPHQLAGERARGRRPLLDLAGGHAPKCR